MYVMGTSELAFLPSNLALNPLSNVKKRLPLRTYWSTGGGEHDNDNGPRYTKVLFRYFYVICMAICQFR